MSKTSRTKAPKTPTPAQQAVLDAIRQGGVERRKFMSTSPRTMSVSWRWVAVATGEPVRERTIDSCVRAGWIKTIRGERVPGAPDPKTCSTWELILNDNFREPDRLELLDPVRAPS